MSLDNCMTGLERELLDKNTLFLQGEVDQQMAEYVLAAMTVLTARDSPAIQIRLSSHGGYERAGLFIARLLQDYMGHKTVRVYGAARSAAVTILLMCDRRLCEEGSTILVHEGRHSWMNLPTSSVKSKARMQELIDEAVKQEETIVRMYSDKTGMPIRRMRKLLAEDRDMSAEEAKELGFIHEIF